MEVERGDGSTVRFDALWADRDCLLVFLRHFACPRCSEVVTELLPRVHEITALGVSVVLIGCGSTAALRAFSERMRLRGVELVVSSDLSAYRAAGLVRSAWSAFGPRSVFTSLKLYAFGHWAARRDDDGDVEQQGGILFVKRGGELALIHADRDLADGAENNDVVEAILSSALERAGALT